MQISPGYETQPQQRTASPGHPENSVDGEGALWQPEYHEPLPQRVPKPSTASLPLCSYYLIPWPDPQL